MALQWWGGEADWSVLRNEWEVCICGQPAMQPAVSVVGPGRVERKKEKATAEREVKGGLFLLKD